jgi:DNA-binding transcriptional regulator YiaG
MNDTTTQLITTSRKRRSLPDPAAAKAIRLAAQLTEREIGTSIGVTAATVCRWERGSRKPRGHQRDAYADLLARLAEELIAAS